MKCLTYGSRRVHIRYEFIFNSHNDNPSLSTHYMCTYNIISEVEVLSNFNAYFGGIVYIFFIAIE